MGERGLAGNGWRRRIWRQEGEGGGDRRRSSDGEGGSGRSPGVPDPVVPNHLETGSGAHHLEATTGDHHRSSWTKKRPPELRDEEDPPEISRIRQGGRGGAVARGWPTTGGESSVALAAGRRGEASAEVEV
uniref:Uncharacterized protein n=1 Tax=Oryza rufipogon TaxID=4529 RepID=A0A0E0PJ50_ORYRU